MGKYEALAKQIVDNVGGKENVLSLTNCITRLRFHLKDESLAETEVLKNMEGVVTVMQAGGQYQVVIGNHVPDVREDIDKILGKLETEEVGVQGNLFDKFVDMISGIFQPILAPLSAAGMIKGVTALLTFFLGASFSSTATYAVFNAMGDGLFHFLPIFIGYTAMKKFKGSPFVGMLIATALVYPGMADGSLASAVAKTGGMNIFGIPFSLPASGYASSVMPIIASVAFAAFLEKQLKKIIPDVVKLFLVPFFTALITIPLTFIVIGPIMNLFAGWLGSGLLAVQTFNPIIFGVLLGFLWQVLVMFGMHWAIIPFAIMALSAGNPTYLLTPALAVSFAQTGAVLAVMLRTKDKRLKELAIPAFISGWFGVTEPAIYGITLPKKRPFWASCVVGGILGGVAMGFGIKEYQMGGLGIFQFTGYISKDGNLNMAIIAVILSIIGVIAGFGVAWLLGFEDGNISTALTKEEAKLVATGKSKKTSFEEAFSPVEGEVLPLSKAKDSAFSEEILGKGALIIPKVGEVRAPFDGHIMTLFPTKHAIGLISDNGLELLIHVGMDTVQLEGKYFESFVKQGDSVKKGELLVKFDKDAIETEGYDTQVPIIITNSADYRDILLTNKKTVNNNENLLTALSV